ncbi:MAG: hypothetical protein ACK5IQ_08670 [Bacteroidales bacterium]
MHSDEVHRLAASAKELVEKWNRRYFETFSVYFKEQATVLEGIADNFLKFKDLNEAHSHQEVLSPLGKHIHKLHIKNLKLLKSLFINLKTREEIKDFSNTITSAFLADINSLGTNTNSFHHLLKSFLLKEYTLYLQDSIYTIQKHLITHALGIFDLESKLIDADYQTDDTYTLQTCLNDFNELSRSVNEFYAKYETTFIHLLENAGTLKLPNFYIRSKSKTSIQQTYSRLETSFKLWETTFYTFYEDWRFREEIFVFIGELKLLEHRASTSYTSKLSNVLLPVIEQKREYLEQLKNRVPNPDDVDLSELKHFFTSELYLLQKSTREQSFEEELNKLSSEIIKLLQKIEIDISESLDNLPEKSGLVGSPNYEKGIRNSKIYYFSPSEFIRFDSVPPFSNRLNAVIQSFTSDIEEIIPEFSDFDHITDFTLDTAVIMINADSPSDQVVSMFEEGVKRSLNILDRISELVNDVIDTKQIELKEGFTAFVESVKKLDDNDKVIGIYSHLLKSKAIQKSKNKRDELGSSISLSASAVGSFIRKHTDKLSAYYTGIRKRLKLDKAPIAVSSEISNYLSDISKRIYELPVIYRYLFENTPVKEVNLFLLRQQETCKIDEALKDWKQNNFAATLMIGENGSGKSSLLHYYFTTIKGSFKIVHLNIDRFYYSNEDFYELMQQVFENPGLENDADIHDHIKKLNSQQIVILDGLERMFLRKPGGFDCLQKLLTFIVSTDRRIFWICSISLHACNYLEKTISIKENFDYLVQLNTLTSDEIKSIILKRHRLSGYVAAYEDDARQSNSKMSERDRQAILEKEFFGGLNKFADSNISLSLYFWLESISEFTDKELYIKRFQTPDFSFLETLSPEKIYTLLLIVLHGRITIETHALICNRSLNHSRKVLIVLKEDSILLKKKDYYVLNGILYRHVVQLLKNKNLIH